MAFIVEENSNLNAQVPGELVGSRKSQLVQFCMEKIDKDRTARDTAWTDLWGEWYRLWRGRHIDADKTYKSERSKLVAPALAQALEMTVAEMEEASFGREQWIDILDDVGDPKTDDIDGLRRLMIDDLKKDKVPSSIAQAMLNGGLWGTLAGKIVVERTSEKKIIDVVVAQATETSPERKERQIKEFPGVSVKMLPLSVYSIIPDADGENVDEMQHITHEERKPASWVATQPWGKSYARMSKTSRVADYDWVPERADREDLAVTAPNTILISEYHGLVPKYLLVEDNSAEVAEKDPLASALISAAPVSESEDRDEMVEAIVTILDKHKLARAMENPFYMKDRSIVATGFEKVPGKFWGRGVMEKGQNPQRALDAELRARMDAMALISNPMLAVNQQALPRGFDLTVRPGKVWLSQGGIAPKDAFMPFQFPGLDPASFNQSSEMERMVQMGTGAMDTATPLAENRRNETSGGMSMIAGTFVKRAKRALRHIGAEFIEPVIQKIIWRRMQFDQSRYPADLQFRIVSTLGIVARELEQSLLINLMGLLPPGSAPQRVAIKAVFDNTSSPYKAEMAAAVEEMGQATEEEKMAQQLEMAVAQLTVQKLQQECGLLESQSLLNMAKIQTELAKPGVDMAKLKLEYDRLEKELQEAAAYRIQSQASFIKSLAEMHKAKKQPKDKKS